MRWVPLAAALLLASVLVASAPPATASQQPCSERQVVGDGNFGVATHSDCSVTVNNKTYDCFWGGHWTTTTVGPVTVRSYSCDPQYEPM